VIIENMIRDGENSRAAAMGYLILRLRIAESRVEQLMDLLEKTLEATNP